MSSFLVRRAGGRELAAEAAIALQIERRAPRSGRAIEQAQELFDELPALRLAARQCEKLVFQIVRGAPVRCGERGSAGVHGASCVTAVVWSG